MVTTAITIFFNLATVNFHVEQTVYSLLCVYMYNNIKFVIYIYSICQPY